MATLKQVAFIKKMAASKDISSLDADLFEHIQKIVKFAGPPLAAGTLLSIGEASDVITSMLDLPKLHKVKVSLGLPGAKKVGRTDWNAPGPVGTIKAVAEGQMSMSQAAEALGVRLNVIGYRLKWYRQYGTPATPEHILKRVKSHSGIEVLVPAEYGDVTQHAIDWAGFFGIEKYEVFDLRVICAMFYAAERFTTAEKIGPQLRPMREAAQRYIGVWAERFAKYTLAACLGEFRHRRKKGTMHLVPMDRRHEARAGCQRAAEFLWTKGEEAAKKATIYMVETFKDHSFFPGGGYGGPKWAKIANTLLSYLEGKLPPIVFADYVWDLSHNGGRFFDKCPMFHKESETRTLLDAKKASKIRDVLPWAGKFLHPDWRTSLDTLEAINWKEGEQS